LLIGTVVQYQTSLDDRPGPNSACWLDPIRPAFHDEIERLGPCLEWSALAASACAHCRLQGRLAWQRITGYNLRNYAELAMQRYKRIFGNTMKARALPQQKTQAWISVSALNRMSNLGMPVSVKV
jgi:hypothetical protein